MNILEVAVYALVIGGQTQPIKCVSNELGTINCTSGLSATAGEREDIHFSNGVTVTKKNGITFSNGITAHIDGAGWLEFSNGIAVRRDSPYRFRVSNGYVCQLAERTMAECVESR